MKECKLLSDIVDRSVM